MTVLLTILKTAGIVLASVSGLLVFLVLLLLFLSVFKIRLLLIYNRGDFIFRVRYLFFSFGKSFKDKKSNGKTESKATSEITEPKESDEDNCSDEDSPSAKDKPSEEEKDSFLERTFKNLTFYDYLEIVKLAFGKAVAKIKAETFKANIRVGGDAYDVAMNYGKINAALYPVLGLLYNTGSLENAEVNIVPDFLRETTEYDLQTELSLRVFPLLVFLISAGKYIYKTNKERQ